MNLAAIRLLTLRRLDDPTGTIFVQGGDDTLWLDSLIQTAYVELVAEMERGGSAWNVARTPVSISVVSTSREYDVLPAQLSNGDRPTIRKPIDVIPFRSGAEGRPLAIIPYSQRNDRGGRTDYLSQLRGVAGGGTVFFYRDPQQTPPMWRLGFSDAEPQAGTVRVYYAPGIETLIDDSDEPVQLPEQWHYLLCTYSALIAKIDKGREVGDLAGQYSAGLARMKANVTSVMHHSFMESL